MDEEQIANALLPSVERRVCGASKVGLNDASPAAVEVSVALYTVGSTCTASTLYRVTLHPQPLPLSRLLPSLSSFSLRTPPPPPPPSFPLRFSTSRSSSCLAVPGGKVRMSK